jgi:hypothetical protein
VPRASTPPSCARPICHVQCCWSKLRPDGTT